MADEFVDTANCKLAQSRLHSRVITVNAAEDMVDSSSHRSPQGVGRQDSKNKTGRHGAFNPLGEDERVKHQRADDVVSKRIHGIRAAKATGQGGVGVHAVASSPAPPRYATRGT